MTHREISASHLKAHCAEVIDSVALKRHEVVVTKHGRPVARIVPIEEEGSRKSLFGFARGCVTIHGDILSPIDVEWEAAR